MYVKWALTLLNKNNNKKTLTCLTCSQSWLEQPCGVEFIMVTSKQPGHISKQATDNIYSLYFAVLHKSGFMWYCK